MVIVGRDKLDKLKQKHADCRTWIDNWLSEVEEAQWTGPNDIKARYSSASFLADRMVIFNVKGNSYRVEVQVAYGTKVVAVRWAGTHAEYDKR